MQNGPSLPSTDESALERLRRLGGEKLMGDLIALFLKSTPERIGLAREGHRAGDASGVRKPMHALKSSSGQLGAMTMMALCERLETQAAENRLDGTGPLLDELEAEFAKVREWLQAPR